MIDRCPIHEAEIAHDIATSLTNAQEYAEYEKLEAQNSYVMDRLLSGKKVYTFSASYDLKERMADKYQEFTDYVNLDYDFMYEYKTGGLDVSERNLIELEARNMASDIVG